MLTLPTMETLLLQQMVLLYFLFITPSFLSSSSRTLRLLPLRVNCEQQVNLQELEANLDVWKAWLSGSNQEVIRQNESGGT